MDIPNQLSKKGHRRVTYPKDFEEWAFGTDVNAENADTGIARMNAWNKLHGDKHWIEPTDLVVDSLEIMQKIYRETLNEHTS